VLRSADDVACADVRDRLEALIDGDLDPAEAVSMTAHLERCQQCRAERRRAVEVRAALRALPVFDPPPRVAAAVMAAVRDDAGTKRSGLPVWLRARPALVAAALAAALLVIVLEPFREPPRPKPAPVDAQRAVADTRLALAVLADVTRRSEGRVRERLVGGTAVQSTVRGLSRSLRWIHRSGAAASAPDGKNQAKSERSS
jgi:anti-sigma factor RsiW